MTHTHTNSLRVREGLITCCLQYSAPRGRQKLGWGSPTDLRCMAGHAFESAHPAPGRDKQASVHISLALSLASSLLAPVLLLSLLLLFLFLILSSQQSSRFLALSPFFLAPPLYIHLQSTSTYFLCHSLTHLLSLLAGVLNLSLSLSPSSSFIRSFPLFFVLSFSPPPPFLVSTTLMISSFDIAFLLNSGTAQLGDRCYVLMKAHLQLYVIHIMYYE